MGRRKGSLNKPKNQGPGGAGLKPGDPNPPWNPAPPQQIETVSMFLECENGHMAYRAELQNAPCKTCGAPASSAMG
jgi:hypothetical protein